MTASPSDLLPPFEWRAVFFGPWQSDALENTLWVLGISLLIGLACGLVGCFLLLRRMALTGDAISHSVLPGVVLAYIFFGTKATWAMLLGASVAGVFAVLAIEFLHRKSRLKSDAATGVAFTTLFALGMLLIRRYADRAHLDVDCVLYGNLEFAVFDTVDSPWGPIPKSFLHMGLITLVGVGLIWVFYKELVLTSFDAALAKSMGLRASRIHYGLMIFTSLIVVAALESVGAVLVVGMLVVPPATARLLADRVPQFLGWTVVLVALASLSGRHLAAWLNTPLAASTMVMSGVLFFIVWIATLLRRLV
jgi:manganese/zinc/iron transport system permease protein